jgi:hypothetical protein
LGGFPHLLTESVVRKATQVTKALLTPANDFSDVLAQSQAAAKIALLLNVAECRVLF